RQRFINLTDCDKTLNYSGKFECDFSPGTADSSKAIGIFKQDGWKITGTFLTETGDYRFLEGELMNCSEMDVSCFDGSHAFLFKLKPGSDGKYHGNAWYGKSGYENWIAKRNDNFQLCDPEKLTFVKDSSNINFTFNDLNGKPVSLSDPKFKGKVVIVQIMGSWCPNCMDETAWMTEVYKKYNAQGLEIIGLAYERSADTAKANTNIRRLKNHYGVDYTLLNTGKSGRDAASASLPFLNGIMSFPTTIYIDRNGKVRMVYTGYNGPATGTAYEKDSAEALRLIQQLLSEKVK
ncbi:MAG TPA: TlpA disulfide reductase family protein, partial [Bacteroidia bacterium]|nr:TlpA disulfide reductase family protein [Bacteroidia bacterium]